eukprot:5376225-Amphidinium_carterae.1
MILLGFSWGCGGNVGDIGNREAPSSSPWTRNKLSPTSRRSRCPQMAPRSRSGTPQQETRPTLPPTAGSSNSAL